jgi:molybdopterin converting factor small subunit
MADASLNKTEIVVLYFAAASTATGLTSERVPLPPTGIRLSSLGALLVSRHPNTNLAKVLEDSQWSVDAEMVDDPKSVELRGDEEVAIICPVSGG